MTYQVIIPAAGQGKRMGAKKNKILLHLNNTPILIHTLRVFQEDEQCVGITLAIHPQDEEEMRELLARYQITKVAALIPGGSERQHSIHNALKRVNQDGIILVHDAARPFVDLALIKMLVKAAADKGAAILAVPVKDTVKKATRQIVTETVERTSLWAIQTPQAFRLAILREAYNRAEAEGFLGTDDASLIERLGKDVYIVEGHYDNIKITTPEDIYFAEAILNKRQRETDKKENT